MRALPVPLVVYIPRRTSLSINSLIFLLPMAPAVVEFRNRSWAREDVSRSLRDSGTGFCCVDEPSLPGLFPRVSLVTSRLAYDVVSRKERCQVVQS